MGNIFQSNAYKNRSVDIPSNSPLFQHRRYEIKTNPEIQDYYTKGKDYNIFINTLKNNRERSNSDSIYLCCKERNYYEENNYTQQISEKKYNSPNII
tara:strand:+ start:427 stop:717 length:291 start_codon:yes stop_codon:yes gene_type:complete